MGPRVLAADDATVGVFDGHESSGLQCCWQNFNKAGVKAPEGRARALHRVGAQANLSQVAALQAMVDYVNEGEMVGCGPLMLDGRYLLIGGGRRLLLCD